MIYFLVTASLYNNCKTRKNQYINGINKLKDTIEILNIENYKIIIIENNGPRNTFLDLLGCEVYYTNNNFLQVNNKGYKELQDILDCINKYNIEDTDFVVKITGRYILEEDSELMKEIKNVEKTKYDCIIKYGSPINLVNYKMRDCITGIIGMRCKYVKKIKNPDENEHVEFMWGDVTFLIDDRKICIVKNVGINVCPMSNTYYLI
jgi:hypothetical protein